MKVALPSKNNEVDNHFGHCQYFTIYTLENKEVIAKERLDAPAGCGCKSNIASTLAQLGVTVMLAGNMGNGAVNILNNNGIQVVRGCSGTTEEVIKAWLADKITDSGEGCSDHGDCHH